MQGEDDKATLSLALRIRCDGHASTTRYRSLIITFPCSAAAPVAVVAAAGPGPAAAAPVVEEKTAFDVVLEEIPADKKVRLVRPLSQPALSLSSLAPRRSEFTRLCEPSPELPLTKSRISLLLSPRLCWKEHPRLMQRLPRLSSPKLVPRPQ